MAARPGHLGPGGDGAITPTGSCTTKFRPFAGLLAGALAAACGDITAPAAEFAPLNTEVAAEDCQATTFAELRAALVAVTVSDRDQRNLSGKIDEAEAKLAAGKNADAVQKLNDPIAKVQQLVAAPKPKIEGDAAALIEAANAAIARIQAAG